MARRRSAKVEMGESRYEVVPLPPHTFVKETPWNREPVERRCRGASCAEMTTRDPAVCDEQFYRIVRKIQARLADRLGRPEKANGHT